MPHLQAMVGCNPAAMSGSPAGPAASTALLRGSRPASCRAISPSCRANGPRTAAGRSPGPRVGSMRPLKPADAVRAVQITSRLPVAHGAPVHIGFPEAIGIPDLDKPDFGDAVPMEPGELPVFWACGVTPQAAIAAARPPFAITHAPGRMLVTDLKSAQLAAI